ncbi:MAG TPA: FAD-binding protein, partial [Mycobacterium sp.]|nr:FAD-binding protein [Mycobacterium sp.]
HAERGPIGHFSAHQSLTGPALEFLRLDGNRPQLPPDEEAPMFALLVGYQYRSAAVMTDAPAPANPDDVLLVDELHGQPGTRVPHAWVCRDGKQVSTLDLLDTGFTVLTGQDGDGWTDAVATASAALGVPISACRIGTGGDADDPDGTWAAVTRLAPDGALLVRPDDFVGWRADKLPADAESALHQVLSTILCRR